MNSQSKIMLIIVITTHQSVFNLPFYMFYGKIISSLNFLSRFIQSENVSSNEIGNWSFVHIKKKHSIKII